MKLNSLLRMLIIACVLMALAVIAVAEESFKLNGEAQKGKVVYEQFCVTCHGRNGDGDGPVGKMMKPKPRSFSDKASMAALTDEQVYKVIANGGASVGKSPLMTAWKGTLTDQQVRDVAAYIRDFGK